MKTGIRELDAKGKVAKAASRRLAYLSTDIKNQALANIADDIVTRKKRYWRPIKSTTLEPKPRA